MRTFVFVLKMTRNVFGPSTILTNDTRQKTEIESEKAQELKWRSFIIYIYVGPISFVRG